MAMAACSSDRLPTPDAIRALALESCAPGDTPIEVSICRCALDVVLAEHDLDSLIELDRRLRDGGARMPADVQEAVLSCLSNAVAPPALKPTKPPTLSGLGG